MPYFDTKVTAMPAGFCGFYAPAVDCRRTRAGLAAGAFAIQHCQLMVQVLPGFVVTKVGESAIGRLVRWGQL
jgi:hypothetical protein